MQCGSNSWQGTEQGQRQGKNNTVDRMNTKPPKPARLEQRFWEALTSEQQGRYKTGSMAKADAEDLANAALKSAKPTPPWRVTDAEIVMGDEEEAD